MRSVVIFVAVACLGAAAAAQEQGSPDAGKALAEANCSQCHNIAAGGAMKLYPPSFAAIAAYMHPDIIPVQIMYPDHASIMPQYNTLLNAANVNDVVAYIRSLDK
ncbi:MAG: cytochrome c [Paracoccaceae bacterium]|nr:cytochrome c [Paracoccaceae bacterium]